MTCDEVRRRVNGSPLDCTRAERAAVFAHLGRCADCQNWWDSPGRLAQPPADFEAAQAVRRADQADPEYRAVVGYPTWEPR